MTKDGLARMLSRMTYSDLRGFADELYEMTQSDDGKQLWDLSQKHQWAEFISGWAEANIPEGDADETPREATVNAE